MLLSTKWQKKKIFAGDHKQLPTEKVEKLSTAQVGASGGVMKDVALIHYPSCTDSIK
jgi:hypothetical protein